MLRLFYVFRKEEDVQTIRLTSSYLKPATPRTLNQLHTQALRGAREGELRNLEERAEDRLLSRGPAAPRVTAAAKDGVCGATSLGSPMPLLL